MKLVLFATAVALGAAGLVGPATAALLPVGFVEGSGQLGLGAGGAVVDQAALTGDQVQTRAIRDDVGSVSQWSVTANRLGIPKLATSLLLLAAPSESFLGDGVDARMTYSFMITGGSGQVAVPMIFHENGDVFHTAFSPGEFASNISGLMLSQGGVEFAGAFTEMRFGDPVNGAFEAKGGDLGSEFLPANGTDPMLESFNGEVAVSLLTNTIYTVDLFNSLSDVFAIGALPPEGDLATFSTFMSTSIGFAPGWDTRQYGIAYSDGFGDPMGIPDPGGSGGPGSGGGGLGAGGVPEPATWSLLIGGFGMAGAALRRRPSRLATTR